MWPNMVYVGLCDSLFCFGRMRDTISTGRMDVGGEMF
jgi:hypothetical protein